MYENIPPTGPDHIYPDLPPLHWEGVSRTTTGLGAVAAFGAAAEADLRVYRTSIDHTMEFPAIEADSLRHDTASTSRAGIAVIEPVVPTLNIVRAADIAAVHFEPSDNHHRRLAMRHREQATTKLTQVRERLWKLGPEESSRLDDYLDESAPPHFKRLANPMPIASGKHALRFGEWQDALTDADDATLARFLRWHVDSLADQQASPHVQEAIGRLKSNYKAGLEQGLDQALLGGKAKLALAEVNDVEVVLGDVFDTVIHGAGGYHETGNNFVVIRAGEGHSRIQRQESAGFHIEDVGGHELNHRFFNMATEWEDEALAEHLTLVLKYGNNRTMDPDARGELGIDSGIYSHRRRLIAHVLDGGSFSIDTSLATRAYTGDHIDVGRYQSMIDESWGDPSAHTKISMTVRDYEEMFAGQGFSRFDAEDKAAELTLKQLKEDPRMFFLGAPY